jgi:prepilin peptidase CpaA
VVLALVVFTAGVYDFRFRRVPNWLVLVALILGIALNVFLFELPGLWLALKGLGLAFLIYFPLYLVRGMGAGDVKLMAAVGALVGPSNWFGIFLITAVLGGLMALFLVLTKGRARRTFGNIGHILRSLVYRQAPYAGRPELDVQTPHGVRLPHAVVIALGAMAFLAAAGIWAPR